MAKIPLMTATSGTDLVTKTLTGIVIPSAISSLELQNAADSAATFGTKLTAAGTLTTSATLFLVCDADLSGLTINYTGTDKAVSVGGDNSATFRKNIKFPKVIAANKTVNGWAQVVGTVGIDIVNCYGCLFELPYAKNFETGLQFRGANGNGSQQNNVRLLHLDNNKVNIRFTGNATGWANQNTVTAGRCSHNSNEGVQVAGTRHIVFENLANPVNGNQFFGTSLESPDVVEYHIEAANTQWNTIFGGRYENTGGDAHRRILCTGATKYNRLDGGAYAANVTQVVTAPAQPWDIDSSETTTRRGGTASMPVMLLENINSSTSPLFYGMESGSGQAGDSPTTAYAIKCTAQMLSGKRKADTFDRVQVDFLNGRVWVGAGTAAPVGYIGGSASTVFVGGGLPFVPLTDAAQDLGITALRWRNIVASAYIKSGSGATASRPNAVTSGAGARWYDTTLSKPIWSDGAVWRDAAGTAV